MKERKLTELFMLRLSNKEKIKLCETASRLGLNAAETARLSLRAGLPLIKRKLSVIAEAPASE